MSYENGNQAAWGDQFEFTPQPYPPMVTYNHQEPSRALKDVVEARFKALMELFWQKNVYTRGFNRWAGHGGVHTEEYAGMDLNELKDKLNELEEFIMEQGDDGS